MGGLLDGLGLGGNALMAQERGIQIASHNITNAATPGFHRREVIYGPNPWPTYGVDVTAVRRITDSILGRRIQTQQGLAAAAESRGRQLSRVESAVGALDDTGLSAGLDRVFGGLRQLTAFPGDRAVRTEVLGNAEDLATRVRSAAAELDATARASDDEIVADVGEVNSLIDQIAAYNRANADPQSKEMQPLDLRDQRDVAVRRLGELIGATAFEDELGRTTVLVSGVHVVQGDQSRHIDVEPDSGTGLHHLVVEDGARVSLDGRVQNGAIGGLLQARDVDVPGAVADLDQFAYDLATSFNAAHQAGVGLDGVGSRDFFAAPTAVAGAAAGLQLDAAVAGNPDAIGAAIDPLALPSDGRNAQALVDLEGQSVAGGGTRTLNGALSDLIGGIGSASARAEATITQANDHLAYLDELSESQSGVSIEEQMLSLSQYQRAFQAASRVITTVDGLLEDLMRM